MGVTGLLPQLKDISENITLEKYRGKTIAIDSYSWLHKSTISCSWELAQDFQTEKYISYFKKRIMMLRHFQLNPYFVFDGDHFQSKKDTEEERLNSRLENKNKGLNCLSMGKRKEAMEYFVKSIDVTPSMAKSIMNHLQSEGIKFIVAPYEADAQMVYLEKLNLVDAIISEDSDLLVFGAKTLLTKLNEFGECVEIKRERFKKCQLVPIGMMNDAQLRMVACLSGCDYTNGIPNIGIIKAFRLVKRCGSMSKCISSIKLEGKVKVPKTFEVEYEKANLSFQYHRVFDPISNEVNFLNEVKEEDKFNEFFEECVGALYDSETHKKIAKGELDPISKTPLLSREESLGSTIQRSLTVPSTSKKNQRATPLIPKRSSTISSITAFFQKSTSTPSVTRQISSPLPSSNQLSPLSKRRKLFGDTNTPQTLKSKFFTSSVQEGTQQQHESPLIEKVNRLPPTPKEEDKDILVKYDMGRSSDYELTDPDNDDIEENIEKPKSISIDKTNSITEKPALEHDDKTLKNETASNDENTEDQSDLIQDYSIEDDNDDGNIPDTQEILKDLNEENVSLEIRTKSNNSSKDTQIVTKGLYEKFSFKNESSVRVMNKLKKDDLQNNVLQPIKQFENKPRLYSNTTRIKTKHGLTRNLTLDSFIYRG